MSMRCPTIQIKAICKWIIADNMDNNILACQCLEPADIKHNAPYKEKQALT